MTFLEAIGGGYRCKDTRGIRAMLARAKELETVRKERKS
jgi:quinone-modifying oxidoreductase, subunit QmoC